MTKFQRLKPAHCVLSGTIEEAAEKVVGFVIPSEARNLLVANDQEKADSSGECGPRNDKFESFSATCLAVPLGVRSKLGFST